MTDENEAISDPVVQLFAAGLDTLSVGLEQLHELSQRAGLDPESVRARLLADDGSGDAREAAVRRLRVELEHALLAWADLVRAGADAALALLGHADLPLAVLRPPDPSPAGATTTAALVVRAPADGAAGHLVATDLIGPGGAAITAGAVTFHLDPHRADGHADQTVEVEVDIPDGVPAGTYHGALVLPAPSPRAAAVLLRIDVTAVGDG